MTYRLLIIRRSWATQLIGTIGCLLALSGSILQSGCDRMITPRNAQILKDADAKAAQGDFLRAINLYEAALDDSPKCADVHYKLALLYDDKMNDPLNAVHHFKRYLTLSPTGSHAVDAKNFMKRDEVALLTNLSGDSVVSRTEAARLRNENLSLRKEIEDRSLKSRAAVDKAQGPDAHPKKAIAIKSESRTYVVKPGDTLASISRKFYKTSARWKEILKANKDKIDNPENVKVGQTLTIP
jgi:LysM repeat protein